MVVAEPPRIHSHFGGDWKLVCRRDGQEVIVASIPSHEGSQGILPCFPRLSARAAFPGIIAPEEEGTSFLRSWPCLWLWISMALLESLFVLGLQTR